MGDTTDRDEFERWLPLYALAGHMAADFPLQTDGMAANKFDSWLVRATHVAVHVAAMVPTVLASDWSWRQRGTFLVTLAATHYTIDSRRWAEPTDEFPTFSIWYDQALHIVTLAVCVGVAERV